MSVSIKQSVAVLTVALATLTAIGAPRNWGGTTDGDWFTLANWAETTIPEAGDDVVVSSGSILLTASTPALASFTITNATLTATNWTTTLTASEVAIRSGGVLTHFNCNIRADSGNTNRIRIVCDNLTVDAGGVVDVTGRGFGGGSQPAGDLNGQGPGGGVANPTLSAGGGSYGGLGGRGHASHPSAQPGPVYGRADEPFQPGSGGGAGSQAGRSGSIGDAGGGAVRVEAAGKVTLNGQIRADGLNLSSVWGTAGGSGGGVFIACATIEGNGLISANGSAGIDEGGGGGGGRIAIHYVPASQQALLVQPALQISLRAYPNNWPYSLTDSQFGTLYLTDDTLLPQSASSMFLTRTHLYGVTNWTADRIGVTNTALFFREPAVTVNVAEDITIGSAGGLDFTLADTAFTVTGNVTLQGGGFLRLRSGPTNGATAYGGSAAVAGTLTVGNTSALYLNADATNGGAVKVIADRVEVASGGQINADGTGFSSGIVGHPNGFGPGGGIKGANSGGGGGHGGAGGLGGHYNSTGGGVYGDPESPTLPGSGGGDTRADGSGGGVIWIEAATSMLIDGMLTANGLTPSGYAGGGAGGGVLLQTPTFHATQSGIIRAHGGNGGSESGGGGGGRIALVGWTTDRFDGTISVVGGAATGGLAGEPGSVYRATEAANDHTLYVVGLPARHGETLPHDYGMHGIADSTSVTIDAPLIAEQDAQHRYYLLGYTLTNATGVVADSTATQATFTVDSDLWLNWNWTNQWHLTTTAGINGALVVDPSGWYTNADLVTVEADADPDYAFLQWAGVGVPLGHENDNPITLAMTRERDIQAVFVSTLPVARVWNGNGTWLTPANWSPEGIPGPIDNVTLQSGTVTLNDSITVGSLTVSNTATLLFNNWTTRLTANDIVVRANGTITHTASKITGNPGNTNRVDISCTTLTVMMGGTINVNGKGYGGGVAKAGEGPGGGSVSTKLESGAGGGYGGIGGISGHLGGYGGIAYGTVSSPNELGSGGGARASGTCTGGAGGGLVRIETTGAVTIDGIIQANGQDGVSGSSGGGAGGGIAIHCLSLTGSGLLSARGGLLSSEGGSGAGGRIAVTYESAVQAALPTPSRVRYTTNSSPNYQASRPMLVTQAGSVYLTDDVILPDAPGEVLLHTNYLHHVTQMVRDNITISNTYIVLTPTPGFKLVTTGDLTLVNQGSLDIDLDHEPLVVGGDLRMAGGPSVLTVRGGPTNGINQAYGTRVAVAGTLQVGSGCTIISHAVDTNGAAIKFEVTDLLVSAGGLLQADGLGLWRSTAAKSRGFGFFAGLNQGGGGYGGTSGGGGGYGGRVGRGNSQNHGDNFGGYTYASSNEPPVYVGSAGGSGNGASSGGRGGGLIWVEADRSIRVDGTISARGGSQAAGSGGGGSGGGIWLTCSRFEGNNGLLRVDGGSVTSGEGGGGGGGRILVFSQRNASSAMQTSMNGGTKVHSAASVGEVGTAAFVSLPASGTVLLLW